MIRCRSLLLVSVMPMARALMPRTFVADVRAVSEWAVNKRCF